MDSSVMRYVRREKPSREDRRPGSPGSDRQFRVQRLLPSREQPCLRANRLVIRRPELRMRLVWMGWWQWNRSFRYHTNPHMWIRRTSNRNCKYRLDTDWRLRG